MFEAQWCESVKDRENGLLVFAGGLLEWFDGLQVKQSLSLLADNFPGAEIVVTAQSRVGKIIGNWSLRRMGVRDIATKWALKDARKLEKWDKRITVVDQFPVFRNFPRDPA